MLGIVVAFWITYGTRYMVGEWAWRLPFLLQMIPGFVLAAGVYMLPFSPRWLASKGRDEEALLSLSKLRSLPPTDRRVRQELLDIQAEVRFHQETNKEKHPNLQEKGAKNSFLLEMASWADCFKKGCWRRTHVGVMLSFFQQVSTLSLSYLQSISTNTPVPSVRRYQCSNLLRTHPLRHIRLRYQYAAHHVRSPQRIAIGRCHH